MPGEREPVPQFCSGTRRSGQPCARRIFDMDADALRPDKRVQLKCPHCNHMNVFVGRAA